MALYLSNKILISGLISVFLLIYWYMALYLSNKMLISGLISVLLLRYWYMALYLSIKKVISGLIFVLLLALSDGTNFLTGTGTGTKAGTRNMMGPGPGPRPGPEIWRDQGPRPGLVWDLDFSTSNTRNHLWPPSSISLNHPSFSIIHNSPTSNTLHHPYPSIIHHSLSSMILHHPDCWTTIKSSRELDLT